MYRILAERSPVRDRRDQLRHPSYAKPELVSSGPNEVWSWDITKLLGPRTWTYYYLYVLLDIYSRYVVGWMIADRENSVLAGRLIAESCTKHGVQPKVLTLHSDRGSPMTSHHTAQLLADLGVTRSLSRPQVSNDNPFSESQFKGLKYHPGFPSRFADITTAQAYCRSFFRWYNAEHRHGGISMLTPEVVHYGRATEVLTARQAALNAAHAANPERFPAGAPTVQPLPSAVYINPPSQAAGSTNEDNGGKDAQDAGPAERDSVSIVERGQATEATGPPATAAQSARGTSPNSPFPNPGHRPQVTPTWTKLWTGRRRPPRTSPRVTI